MSIFAVNYLCREVLRDHAFRAAMKADPAKALAPLKTNKKNATGRSAGGGRYCANMASPYRT